jgi:hypothetical protein
VVRSKECFKCKQAKPLDEFYKHSQMGDGYLNKCKECAKSDATNHRLANLEKVRAYDKQRAALPHRRDLAAKVNKLWYQEDKRRKAAHNAVIRAVRKGVLTPEPCVRCGNQKSLAHHEDYDKKLEVMWLCQPCHKARHKEIKG